MRILVVNPNTTDAMTTEIEAAGRRYAAATTTVDAISAPWGPRSIETHVEEALAAAATAQAVAEHRGEYDAFVIACYGDPGLYAAREIADVPVVGIAEASMFTACALAHTFSIVSVIPRIIPMLKDMVRRYGMEQRCASVRACGLAVLDLGVDVDAAREAILAEARLAIAQDGAEAITLGCAGMGPLEDWLRARLPGTPIIDGVAAAVTFCETLHARGFTTSRVRAFDRPGPKELVGAPLALQRALTG